MLAPRFGCGLCQKQCDAGAIRVTDNLARINYAECVQCGKCVEKCPAKVITPPVAAIKEDIPA